MSNARELKIIEGDVKVTHNATVEGTLRVASFHHPYGSLFPDRASLEAEYPSPSVGMWAWVGSVFPYEVYRCETVGHWTLVRGGNSGNSGGIDESSLAQYLLQHGYATQQWVKSQGYLTTVPGGSGGGGLDVATLQSYLNEHLYITEPKLKEYLDANKYVTEPWVTEKLTEKLDKAVFDDLFEKVTLPDGSSAIRAKYSFYTEGFLSGRGIASDIGEGGTGGGNGLDEAQLTEYLTSHDYIRKPDLSIYATREWILAQGYINQLPDGSGSAVDLSKYATQEWVNTRLSNFNPSVDLSSYATQSWVTSKGYLTKNDASDLYLGKSAKAKSAETADTLTTARKLWGNSFNGSSDINGTMTPSSTATCGTTASRWATMYAKTVDAATSVKIGSGTISWNSSGGYFEFSHGVASQGFVSGRGVAGDVGGGGLQYLTETAVGSVPYVLPKGNVNLGNSSTPFSSAYLSKLYLGGSEVTPSKYGTGLYLSGSTLYLRNGSTNLGSVTLPSGGGSTFAGGTITSSIYPSTSDSLVLGDAQHYFQIVASRMLALYGTNDEMLFLSPESGGISFASNKPINISCTKLTLNGKEITAGGSSSGGGSSLIRVMTSPSTGATNQDGTDILSPSGKIVMTATPNFFCPGMDDTATARSTNLGAGDRPFATVFYSGSLSHTSDMEKKEKVSDVALTVAQVAEAPSITYQWKSEADNPDAEIQIGSSAQYWHEVLPEVVTVVDGHPNGFDYSVAALASAIACARAIQSICAHLGINDIATTAQPEVQEV